MAAGPATNSELPLPTTENHWNEVMGYIRGVIYCMRICFLCNLFLIFQLETDFSDLTNHLRQMILECGSDEFPLLEQQQHVLVDEMHEDFADLRIAMENLESALDDDEPGILGGSNSGAGLS